MEMKKGTSEVRRPRSEDRRSERLAIGLTEEDLGPIRALILREKVLPALEREGITVERLVINLLDTYIKQRVEFD